MTLSPSSKQVRLPFTLDVQLATAMPTLLPLLLPVMCFVYVIQMVRPRTLNVDSTFEAHAAWTKLGVHLVGFRVFIVHYCLQGSYRTYQCWTGSHCASIPSQHHTVDPTPMARSPSGTGTTLVQGLP